MNCDKIDFSDEDLKRLEFPHNDALVISMMVANARLDKIKVTTGMTCSFLYLSTLEKKLRLTRSVVRPVKQTLGGIFGEELESVGTITLPVTAGDEPRVRTFMVDFLVVDSPANYDIIFGLRGLSDMGAVVSVEHLMIRFRTDAGIGEVRGDQQKARECETGPVTLQLYK